MKRFTAVILCLVISTTIQTESYAHSGGTDKYGCHAGTRPYHCHNSKSGGGSNGGSDESKTNWDDLAIPAFTLVIGVTLVALVVILFRERQRGYFNANDLNQTLSDFELKPEINSENRGFGLRFKLNF